jgi:hypothetical protein
MEPEVWLPRLQQPVTGYYPEPTESSPHPHTIISLRSLLILSAHQCLVLPSGLFPSGFPITGKLSK